MLFIQTTSIIDGWAGLVPLHLLLVLSSHSHKRHSCYSRIASMDGFQWLTPVILATQGGRDQEDPRFQASQVNSLHNLVRSLSKKRASGVGQAVRAPA
jgi:hypothetical protein